MTVPVGSRYLTLDHWRALAALWVMLYHANRGKAPLDPIWLDAVVDHGWLGVQVFFVISGYCIAERVAREQRRQGSVLGFAQDRFLRIYPPYWAALGVTIVVGLAGAWFKGGALSAPYVLPQGGTGWLAAASAMEPWFDRAPLLLVGWTLTYEIGFYICAALGLALALRTGRAWIGVAWWGLLAIVGLVPAFHGWIPLLYLWPHFALGGLVWLAWHTGATTAARLLRGGAGIGLVALVAWAQPASTILSLHAACLVAALLLVLRIWDARLAALPALRGLGWIGTFSYSLYLIHAPLLGKFGLLLQTWPPLRGRVVLVELLSCLCVLPCAWLFYRIIELRSEAFRHRLARGIKPAPAASGSPTA